MEDSQVAEPRKSRIPKFFSNPLVGLTASLASIFGIPFSIFLFFQSLAIRNLSYYVSPIKTTVLSTAGISKLKVFYGPSEITNEVTAAQVAIWNAGKLPIKPSDILKPIAIRTDPPARIIEAKLRRQSRDVVSIDLAQSESQVGSIPISWKILEKNDGGVVQIIYVGSADVKIMLEGVIEGQGNPASYRFKGKLQTPEEQFSQKKTWIPIVFGIEGMVCWVMLVISFRGAKKHKEMYRFPIIRRNSKGGVTQGEAGKCSG